MPASIVLDDGRLEVRRVNVELLSLQDSDSDEEGSVQINGTRKRRRLTNLTPEEKMMRRKLKNRMAAQTARDRKKQKMAELEEALAAMEAENKKLLEENQTLKLSTTSLSRENAALKNRLSQPETANDTQLKFLTGSRFDTNINSKPMKAQIVAQLNTQFDTTRVIKLEQQSIELEEVVLTSDGVPAGEFGGVVSTGRGSEPTESAVLSPQQQDSARGVLSLLTAVCLQQMLPLISLVHLWTCWMGTVKAASSSSQAVTPPTSSSSMNLPSPNNPALPPWWGSHQKNWNPSKN